VEALHRAVLDRARHSRQVRLVAHRLEIAADEQQVDLHAMLLLGRRDGRVDRVELAMAATLHRDLREEEAGRTYREVHGGYLIMARTSISRRPEPKIETVGLL